MKEKIKEKTKDLITKTKCVYYLTKESILRLGETIPEERKVYSIDELYTQGEVFGEEDTLVKSLLECFAIEEAGGRVASAPEIVLMRNKSMDHLIWESSFDTFSSEHIGVDSKGRFTYPGGHVIVFAHNTGIPSIHTLLDKKLNPSLLEKGVRYDQYFFDELLSGKTQDGLSIDLYNINDYTKGYQPEPYGLVMPISQEEIDKRRKRIFSKGIRKKHPEKSYYCSTLAKGRSGLDTDTIRTYVENCMISTKGKPLFFDYLDYDLPREGEAEIRLIIVNRLGFLTNNKHNPHIFYGIRGPVGE